MFQRSEKYTHSCSVCGRTFQSFKKKPKLCRLCGATGWEWQPGKSLTWAPMRVIGETIEPFINDFLSDPEIKIINVRNLDHQLSSINADWGKVFVTKRLKTIIATLMKTEPTLIRGLKNDGVTGSHLFYRTIKSQSDIAETTKAAEVRASSG